MAKAAPQGLKPIVYSPFTSELKPKKPKTDSTAKAKAPTERRPQNSRATVAATKPTAKARGETNRKARVRAVRRGAKAGAT